MLSDFDEPHSVRRRNRAGFYRRDCVLQRSWRSRPRMVARRTVEPVPVSLRLHQRNPSAVLARTIYVTAKICAGIADKWKIAGLDDH